MMATHDLTADQALVIERSKAIWHYVTEKGMFFTIVPLMYHVSVYVEPNDDMGYDDRYCFSNATIAEIAIKEFELTGTMRHWQKHHNTNISVVGSYAYAAGAIHVPDQAMHKVDWDACLLREKYPFISQVLGGFLNGI